MSFEKLDGFNIEYTKEQTLIKNVAILTSNQFRAIHETSNDKNKKNGLGSMNRFWS